MHVIVPSTLSQLFASEKWLLSFVASLWRKQKFNEQSFHVDKAAVTRTYGKGVRGNMPKTVSSQFKPYNSLEARRREVAPAGLSNNRWPRKGVHEWRKRTACDRVKSTMVNVGCSVGGMAGFIEICPPCGAWSRRLPRVQNGEDLR